MEFVDSQLLVSRASGARLPLENFPLKHRLGQVIESCESRFMHVAPPLPEGPPLRPPPSHLHRTQTLPVVPGLGPAAFCKQQEQKGIKA